MLVAVRMAVLMAMMFMVMAMLVVMAVLMRMVMAATAAGTVLVRGRLAVLNVQHIALASGRVMGVRMTMVIMAMVVIMRIVVMCMVVMCVGMMLVIMVRMIVMVMIVMVMAAAAGLAMGVVVMVVMAVGVVPVCLGGFIGAAFRLEGRVDHRDGRAKATRHLLEHAVAGDADAIGKKLRRHMAVTQMPGEPRQMMRILRHDLRHRLLGRNHRYDAPVFEREAVSVFQPRRLDKVEQERHVALAAHGDTAAVAPVMRKHHTVGGGSGIPAAGGKHSAGTDHGTTPVGRRAISASSPNP